MSCPTIGNTNVCALNDEYSSFKEAREWKSLKRGGSSEVLASGKVAWSDPYTEVSQTAKLGTDEQKLYKRHNERDEHAQQCEVQNDCSSLCRCSSHTAKAIHLTGGGLLVCLDKGEVSRGHSNYGYEPCKREDSRSNEGLNIKLLPML